MTLSYFFFLLICNLTNKLAPDSGCRYIPSPPWMGRLSQFLFSYNDLVCIHDNRPPSLDSVQRASLKHCYSNMTFGPLLISGGTRCTRKWFERLWTSPGYAKVKHLYDMKFSYYLIVTCNTGRKVSDQRHLCKRWKVIKHGQMSLLFLFCRHLQKKKVNLGC